MYLDFIENPRVLSYEAKLISILTFCNCRKTEGYLWERGGTGLRGNWAYISVELGRRELRGIGTGYHIYFWVII